MRIYIGSSHIDLDVLSFAPRYESGIEWRNVGSYYKPIDRGTYAEKWATDIVVSTDSASALRNMLKAHSNESPIFLVCNSYEFVFGCEFFFSPSYQIACYVDKSVLSLASDTKEAGLFGRVYFPLVLATYGDVYQYDQKDYLTTSSNSLVYDDLNICIKSINRIGNRDFQARRMEESYNGFGFETEQLLTEVTYTAKNYRDNSFTSDLATAKRWFETRRNNVVSIPSGSSKSYLFDVYSSSQNCYVIDIQEGDYSNGKTNQGTLKITYGKA